jgi:hypothetical protein
MSSKSPYCPQTACGLLGGVCTTTVLHISAMTSTLPVLYVSWSVSKHHHFMSLSLLVWALVLAPRAPLGASQATAGNTIVGCSATTDGEEHNLWFGAISGANCWVSLMFPTVG